MQNKKKIILSLVSHFPWPVYTYIAFVSFIVLNTIYFICISNLDLIYNMLIIIQIPLVIIKEVLYEKFFIPNVVYCMDQDSEILSHFHATPPCSADQYQEYENCLNVSRDNIIEIQKEVHEAVEMFYTEGLISQIDYESYTEQLATSGDIHSDDASYDVYLSSYVQGSARWHRMKAYIAYKQATRAASKSKLSGIVLHKAQITRIETRSVFRDPTVPSKIASIERKLFNNFYADRNTTEIASRVRWY